MTLGHCCRGVATLVRARVILYDSSIATALVSLSLCWTFPKKSIHQNRNNGELTCSLPYHTVYDPLAIWLSTPSLHVIGIVMYMYAWFPLALKASRLLKQSWPNNSSKVKQFLHLGVIQIAGSIRWSCITVMRRTLTSLNLKASSKSGIYCQITSELPHIYALRRRKAYLCLGYIKNFSLQARPVLDSDDNQSTRIVLRGNQTIIVKRQNVFHLFCRCFGYDNKSRFIKWKNPVELSSRAFSVTQTRGWRIC